MNGRSEIAVLAVLLTALLAVVLVPMGADADGVDRGSVSSDGIEVGYEGSSYGDYGFLYVSIDSPGGSSYVVTIDGKRSAPVPVSTGSIMVDGGMSVGSHNIKVECGGDVWNLVLSVTDICEHSWDSGKVTKGATCTGAGVRTYTCSICGETETATIPATGHSWSGWTVVKQATSAEEGLKERTCSVCGEVQQQKIPKTGHEHSWDSGKVTEEATCTESGTRTYICSICGGTKTETIPATGHSWSGWTVVTEPTEEIEGEKQRTCQSCGAEGTNAISRVVVVDNGDGTRTGTSEDADGTKVSRTTGYADGSVKIEVTSADGNVGSSAVIGGSGTTGVITVMKVDAGSVVSKEQMEQAIAVQDRISGEVPGDTSKVIVVESQSSDAKLTLSRDAAKAVSGSGADMKVVSGKGSVSVSDAVMSGISGNGDVSISIGEAEGMTEAQKRAVAGGTVADVSITSGGRDVGSSLGGFITISLKHTPADGKAVAAYYIDGNGDRERMEGVVYDPASGEVSFSTSHCSLYMVIDEEPSSDGGDNTMLFVCIGIAIVMIAAVAVLAARKRP